MNLVKETIRRCLKMSKRTDRFIGEPMVETAEKLWSAVLQINILYARKDDISKALRTEKILEALGHCDFLIGLLEIAVEMNSTLLTEAQWSHWFELIAKQIQLLEGLKKKTSKTT